MSKLVQEKYLKGKRLQHKVLHFTFSLKKNKVFQYIAITVNEKKTKKTFLKILKDFVVSTYV